MAYVTSAQRQDVIVVGDVATDVFIRLPESSVQERSDASGRYLVLPFGTKVLCERSSTVAAGGDAANAAVAFARLGLRVALASFVAHDQFARDLFGELRLEGVSSSLVHVDEPAETNRNYILWFGADRTILSCHQKFNYHWPYLRPSDIPAWIYLTSVGPNAMEYEDQITDWLEGNEAVKLGFRPGTAQLEAGMERLSRLFARSEVLIIAEDDARALIGDRARSVSDLASALLDTGAQRVVLPDRVGGGYAADHEHRYVVPPFPDTSPIYERTGADDAFAATVVHGLIAQLSFAHVLERAPVNAMSVKHELGSQSGLLRDEQLEAYLKEVPGGFAVEIQ